MTTFYCTRCGAHLEISGRHADGMVVCGNCHQPTRIPEVALDRVPVARVVQPPDPALQAFVESWPRRHHDEADLTSWHDVVAADLANVRDDSGDKPPS